MRYWWVNQNQTYQHEVSGGFLWSPKVKTNGVRNQYYDYMQDVHEGDVIFSFCDTRIKAIGIAQGRAETAPKPAFGKAGSSWSEEGWLVPVAFKPLPSPIRPKDHMQLLAPLLPAKYAPLQANGNGLQAVYLTTVPEPLAAALIDLIGTDFSMTLAAIQPATDETEQLEDQAEEAIHGRTDIGATAKTQLIKSRRGQGIFKNNVRLNEKGCRMTGVTDLQHLRASHIKPWKDSTDEEKLSGCNGLLLAPHIDHLFDKGFISFTDEGDLLISPRLERRVLAQWGLSETVNVGKFSPQQAVFLNYHRSFVFKQP
ncbi:HNH endonuclease [Paludibacterium sp. B53371]|uniref:HNH endonuclease n=1 Tax=Paludibacterium sp. B53371 TaxID=2806263 RepID=UPI001C0493DD|nr:HNH endonuclease signature motif containing protein [Paludibacterium sp. B53371]